MPRSATRKGRRGKGGDTAHGFSVREPASGRHRSSSQASSALRQLQQMFSPAVPAVVIREVLQQCGPALEPCIEALLAVSQAAEPPAPGQEMACRHQQHRAQRWAAVPDDCRVLIVAKLQPRDVAAIACVSKDLARCAAIRRAQVTCVRLKGSCTRAHQCIAAHPNAAAVCSACSAFSLHAAEDVGKCG